MEALTCSLASLQAGEQLFGTAPEVKTWLLLEIHEPLTARALVDNHLPEPVRAYLNAQAENIPGSRLLLIQQGAARRRSVRRFFIASSAARQPVVLEYRLENYHDLLQMDLPALAANPRQEGQPVRSEPLYLVCTNGKRDACCAAHGAPFYRRLAALEPANAWQCSHVGGHRFAANAIYLPYGIYYGRLRAGQEEEFLLACRESRLLHAHYRGRSTYPAHIQAAEYYLFQQHPDLRLDAIELEQVADTSPYSWQVQFRRRQNGERYSIHLAAAESGYQIFENCGKQHELSRKTQYRLLE